MVQLKLDDYDSGEDDSRSIRLQRDDPDTRSVRLQPDPLADRPRGRSHGEVHVVSRVVGFKKIKFYTNENVGSGELDLPEQQMHTSSYWLTIPSAVMAALPYGGDDRRDGVVGLAFAMRHVAQLLLMCDRHDIGAVDRRRVARADQPRTGRRVGACPRRWPPSRTSSSTTTIRAASASAGRCSTCTRAARAHARADRRLPVRVRLSVVRRARRQHRPARQAGRVADPRRSARLALRPRAVRHGSRRARPRPRAGQRRLLTWISIPGSARSFSPRAASPCAS